MCSTYGFHRFRDRSVLEDSLHSNCSPYSDPGITQVEYLLARAFSVSVSEKTLFARKLKAAKTFPLQIRENVFSSSWKEHGWLPFSKGSCLYGFRKHFFVQPGRAALNTFLLVNEQNLELALFYL